MEGYEASANLWARRVLNPLSTQKITWDLFIGLAILASVVQTPIMLGFKEELLTMPEVNDQLKVFDTLIMCLFFFDMTLVFLTAYENDAGVIVTPPVLIRQEYLKLWFWIDMASTVPWDVIGGDDNDSDGGGGSGGNGFSNATATVSSGGAGELSPQNQDLNGNRRQQP